MGAAGSLISLLILAVISVAPLTAATFVGARIGYRGIALIAPWIGAVAFALLAGFAFAAIAQGNPERVVASTVSAWAGAMLVSGYFSTLVYLIVLASRRLPTRPVDTAAVF